MNLYHIKNPNPGGTDTFDSAVVAALDSLEASHIHPEQLWSKAPIKDPLETWCEYRHVEVIHLGGANVGTLPGVICASFNAG